MIPVLRTVPPKYNLTPKLFAASVPLLTTVPLDSRTTAASFETIVPALVTSAGSPTNPPTWTDQ